MSLHRIPAGPLGEAVAVAAAFGPAQAARTNERPTREPNQRFVDIVTINSEIEVAYLANGLEASATGLEKIHFHGPQYSQPKARPHEHCSAFVATGPATSDGRIVLGHITMSELAKRFSNF